MTTKPATVGETLDLLSSGDVEVLGLIPHSSNYTFLAKVTRDEDEILAIYKPIKGERPLWDFPPGTLAAREVAAFRTSEAGAFGLVPPTVLRADAPLGEGSLQLFIEHDPNRHFFVLFEERPEDFTAFAAFDVVINNADRKSGHVLEGKDGRLWGVDHGVSFHVEPKLRTVIWEFAEQPLGERTLRSLERLEESLQDGLGEELTSLLTAEEAEATLTRVRAFIAGPRFPKPESDRPLPWPLV